jgi:hypothetical protein
VRGNTFDENVMNMNESISEMFVSQVIGGRSHDSDNHA